MITVAALVLSVLAAARGVWSPCGLSMLSSLNPVAERARGHRFWPSVLWYVSGAALGGLALGLGCAAGAFALSRIDAGADVVWAITLAGALVAVLSDSTLTRHTLPMHPRQVDERWLVRYRRWIYAGGYGVQIGSGFATYIMTAAVYLTALLAVLTARPVAAVAIGVTFGIVRGLAILVTTRATTPQRLRTLIAGIDRLGPASLRVACASSAGVAVLAAWQLAGPMAAAALTIGFVGLALLAWPGRRTRQLATATG